MIRSRRRGSMIQTFSGGFILSGESAPYAGQSGSGRTSSGSAFRSITSQSILETI